MASYYATQAYDAPSSFIWSVLTDFPSWPAWFPNMTKMTLPNGAAAGEGTELTAMGDGVNDWSRWRIAKWQAPSLLLCEHLESTAPISRGIEAAYLQFALLDDPEGCTLEVEVGAESTNIFGDFFVGVTLGAGARRMLPQLVDAFSRHVVQVGARR